MQARRSIRPIEAFRPALSGTGAARLFLLFEAVTFAAAAAIHAGALFDGHRHREAAIAETVIAIVLIAGLAVSWTHNHGRFASRSSRRDLPSPALWLGS